MKKVLISGGLIPTTRDTVLDARTRVKTFADIANIENPALWLVITVEDTGKKYEVRKLAPKVIGGIEVPNARIDIEDPDALFDLGKGEEDRVEAERVRKANEAERVDTESLRKVNETERKDAEVKRDLAESARNIAENERVVHEDIRVQNEGIRVSNENERKRAETDRVNKEMVREVSEGQRKASEKERKDAEIRRENDEALRNSDESERKKSESERKNNETTRQSAEISRGLAEVARANGEVKRTENELTRVGNENERVDSETNRKNEYGVLKVQMEETINEGREVTESVLAAFERLIPSNIEVSCPKRITLGNMTPGKVEVKFTPKGTLKNVIYMGDNKSVSVLPDGELRVTGKGVSTIHVIPTCNTQLFKTVQVEVVSPQLRMVKKGQLRLTQKGNLRLT